MIDLEVEEVLCAAFSAVGVLPVLKCLLNSEQLMFFVPFLVSVNLVNPHLYWQPF